ncbi:Crp/Fnr family transcriptional regulator [Acetohalobium arabaticum]|uniref:Transcriptional regulator, Crp/Fnr family n=1 Tax=Acetohalobium arabaticum (strain ATCC 49924 / DSM 5501 / Z-7288) TaxID=574087 RepID=D9QQB0_ACEAZ|nr:Crp/Fnr family transcriptional regulator [Acetohalobium arabaticum]ADL12701.1 transcriptional regulator, Crp/Fnr family [Acetohalobium arabaticum DSM 5501]
MIEKKVLKNSSYFATLSEKNLDKIVNLMFVREYKEGEIIFFEEEKGEGLFFIKSGKVKIAKIVESGEEQILHILKQGEIFAEVVLFDGSNYPATAIAMEDSQIGILRNKDIERLITEVPEIALKILKVMSKRLRRAQQTIRNLGLKNTESRTASILLYLAKEHGIDGKNRNQVEINLSLSQQELSNLVGASRETISRVLKKLKEKDLIATSRQQIVIKDLLGLKRII